MYFEVESGNVVSYEVCVFSPFVPQRKLLMDPYRAKTGPSTWRSATSLMRQRKGKEIGTAKNKKKQVTLSLCLVMFNRTLVPVCPVGRTHESSEIFMGTSYPGKIIFLEGGTVSINLKAQFRSLDT